MFAYCIARFDITDPEGAKTIYPQYQQEAKQAYVSHQARFLVRGGAAHALEGAGRARNVVIGFPNMTVARAWFGSEAYQSARRHRLAVATGEMALVEGLTSDLPAPDEEGTPKKGYWIGRYDVRDMEQYKLYIEGAAPAFEQYGAHFLARGAIAEALEGEARGRNAIIEFASVDQALACYRSPTYQEARAHRLPVAEADIVIVEGA